MSIASRIDNMYDNVEKAYKSINKLGVDLTDVDKNIENISPLLDDFYDTLPKVTGTGETLTLNNTSEAPMKIDLKGNTSQASEPTPSTPVDVNVVSGDNTIKVEGKNLYNMTSATARVFQSLIPGTTTNKLTINSFDSNNIKITDVSNGFALALSNIMQLEPNTTYYLSYTRTDNIVSGGQARNYFYNWNSVDGYTLNTNLGTGNISTTFTTDSYGYVALGVGYNNASAGSTSTISNIQIEKSSSASSYQPYTSQTQLISLGVENLIPTQESAWEQGNINENGNVSSTTRIRTIDYYPIKNDTNYHISVQDTNYCYLNIRLYNSSKTYLNEYYAIDYSINGATDKTINIPSSSIPNVAYMRVVLRKSNNTSTITLDEITTIKPQIEKGSKANSYTPYGTTPIELCKIGDYQDYIYKESNKWYLHKEIGKVVLDGSENWQYISVTQGGIFRNNDAVTNDINDNKYIPYSNNYKGIAYNNYLNRANNQFYIQSQNNFLDIIDNRYTSASDFKTWLGTHNTIVYYVLATPTNTIITDTELISQLDNLQNLNSYNPTTNIMQENNDKPFIITASALKDLSNL